MKLRLVISTAVLLLSVGMSQAAKPEFRAIQVHTWIPGMLSQKEIDETVQWAKDANMNVLIMQARRVGDAYYDSAYEPRASNIDPDPSFDPLGYSIKKGHENGLEVHAWFNVYRSWSTIKKPADPDHIVNQHPEWINKDFTGSSANGDGLFLDPGAPGVREYMVKLTGDIVSKYDVDGFMLDFVRYPGKTWGYSDSALAAFNATYRHTGRPSPNDVLWSRWRREQVTETVRAMYAEVNRLKPWVKFSAATIPWGPCQSDFIKTDAYAEVFQDWQRWMREGILDINMPMNYKNPADSRQQGWYTDWLVGMKKWSYGRPAYSTIMVFRNDVAGAAEQVRLAQERGMPGVAGFAFSQTDCRAELAAKLKATVFKEPVSVPTLPWKAKKPSGN